MRRGVTIRKRRRVGFATRGEFWFDAHTASRAVDIIETHCHYIDHLRPEMVGRPIRLEPDQKFRVEELFGWKRKDAAEPADCSRQYRTLYLEEPRGNGKSTEAACIVIVVLYQDHEAGGQIYSAASELDQARIIFNIAKELILGDETMSRRVEILKDSIYLPAWGTVYRPIPASHKSKHGLNAHCIVVDEVHVHEDRELIDVLRTSQVKRRQPLEIYTTTAGFDQTSICWELHKRAKSIIKGDLVDDTFLPFVYGATIKDDWTSPKVWAKANPNLGVSVKPEYIAAECKRALQIPAYRNNFQRLHLNIWTLQQDMWIDPARWAACRGIVDTKAMEGFECYGALDLASTKDLACWLLLFPIKTGEKEKRNVIPRFDSPRERGQWFDAVRKGKLKPEQIDVETRRYLVAPRFYMPEDNIAERVERDKVKYDVWAEDGFIIATPGPIIDYDYIRNDVGEDGKRYDIKEIAIDRWNATQITTQLAGDGFEVFFHGQGFASMGQPSRDFEAMVHAKRMVHNANPVLDWMIGNVAVEIDAAGFPKPHKGKSTEKIDGVVCVVMALGRTMLAETAPTVKIPSGYTVVTV